ncbi:MAG TPA: sigma-70 family RNA polymerase sigma factor [Williamwhitmania sp.]|nr:sigma-70 family RNA polymerase sigma factor [Williamwhitmania sp.]
MPNPSRDIINDQEQGLAVESTYSFDLLVDQYKNMVYSIAFRMVGNRDDALEVSQDAFMQVHKNLSRFKGESRISTWVYRIAYNEALMHLRKRKQQPLEIEYGGEAVSFTNVSLAIENLSQEERKRYISVALAHLSGSESTALTLYYLEEQTIEEVALIMDISEANVKVKLFRARAKFHVVMMQLLNVEIMNLL